MDVGVIQQGPVVLLGCRYIFFAPPPSAHINRRAGHNSFPDFLHAMQQVTEQGVEGVVLDLRGNTGGSVQAAYSMASALLSGRGPETGGR